MAHAHSENGFTLVEFLVSVVILMVGLLGLLQAVNLSLQHNLTNEYRNEATTLADAEMVKEAAKGTTIAGFNAISTVTKRYPVNVKVLNAFKTYSVVKTGVQRTLNTKEIAIQVRWSHRGQNYSHGTSSLVSLSQQ